MELYGPRRGTAQTAKSRRPRDLSTLRPLAREARRRSLGWINPRCDNLVEQSEQMAEINHLLDQLSATQQAFRSSA